MSLTTSLTVSDLHINKLLLPAIIWPSRTRLCGMALKTVPALNNGCHASQTTVQVLFAQTTAASAVNTQRCQERETRQDTPEYHSNDVGQIKIINAYRISAKIAKTSSTDIPSYVPVRLWPCDSEVDQSEGRSTLRNAWHQMHQAPKSKPFFLKIGSLWSIR